MRKFLETVGENEILLEKNPIVAFSLVGESGDLLLSSCDFAENIYPAISKLVGDVCSKDEEMADYVKNSRVVIHGYYQLGDVYSSAQKCIVGSVVVKSFTSIDLSISYIDYDSDGFIRAVMCGLFGDDYGNSKV